MLAGLVGLGQHRRISDWGQGKRQQKLASNGGEGWLLSPFGGQVVRISSGDESLHAKWCEVSDAERDPTGRLQIGHRRRMLRYNAVQLWHNLCRQGWRCVPPSEQDFLLRATHAQAHGRQLLK